MRLTAIITAALVGGSASLIQACSPGFSSNRNLSPAEYAWLFADYSVENVSDCGTRCARQCTAPGQIYGACMGCARWKINAQGFMDLPPCSRPDTTVPNDGEYKCQGLKQAFWNCITPCPFGYEEKDIGHYPCNNNDPTCS